LEAFFEFCHTWLPEMVLHAPTLRDHELDIFYREANGGNAKELVWAGDGLQIFVQLLLHVWRLRDASTIILDEPDVYLHADLQRRLLRTLDSVTAQVIVATHSSEILMEAPPEAVVWMDRSRRRAIRAPDAATLTELSRALGTYSNLRLARVMRARLALFVEGEDVGLLRHFARATGTQNVVAETGLAVVPLEGQSNWRRLEGFAWLVDAMLTGSVNGELLLDRDYHSEAAVARLLQAVRRYGLSAHVWDRHELESYVLEPTLIARVSGASIDWITTTLDGITAEMYGHMLSRMISARYEDGESRAIAIPTVSDECEAELSAIWQSAEQRLWKCPAKEVISRLNDALRAYGHRAVSPRGLARSMNSVEVPDEMVRVLRRIDRHLAASASAVAGVSRG
jgi:energy-coupling factor transporter ATP-binding protein EcfA2